MLKTVRVAHCDDRGVCRSLRRAKTPINVNNDDKNKQQHQNQRTHVCLKNAERRQVLPNQLQRPRDQRLVPSGRGAGSAHYDARVRVMMLMMMRAFTPRR